MDCNELIHRRLLEDCCVADQEAGEVLACIHEVGFHFRGSVFVEALGETEPVREEYDGVGVAQEEVTLIRVGKFAALPVAFREETED